jgi:hypothetical protein
MNFAEYWALYWESQSLSGELERLVKVVAEHAWHEAKKDESGQSEHLQDVMDAYEITERTSL